MITYTKVFCYKDSKQLKCREATTAEYNKYYELKDKADVAKKAYKLAKENYKKIIEKCDHKFFYDKDDDYIYYHRHCAVCNKFLTLI